MTELWDIPDQPAPLGQQAQAARQGQQAPPEELDPVRRALLARRVLDQQVRLAQLEQQALAELLALPAQQARK